MNQRIVLVGLKRSAVECKYGIRRTCTVGDAAHRQKSARIQVQKAILIRLAVCRLAELHFIRHNDASIVDVQRHRRTSADHDVVARGEQAAVPDAHYGSCPKFAVVAKADISCHVRHDATADVEHCNSIRKF